VSREVSCFPHIIDSLGGAISRLFSQRRRERRESYRPAGEPIKPRLYEVAELVETGAKAFLLANHSALSCLAYFIPLHDPKHEGLLYGPPVSAVRADLDPNP
jgi:hypothetical protein